MEPTFKIVLDKRYQKKNLTYPLKMRVFQDRKYKSYSLNIDLRENDWDEQLQQVKTSNSNHKLYNVKISSLKAKVQNSIFFNEDEETVITPDEIINQVSRNGHKKAIPTKPDIFLYGKEHIAKLELSEVARITRTGNSIVYSCAMSKLKSFVNTDKLTFEAISYKFLEDFNISMLADGIKVNSMFQFPVCCKIYW